MNKMIKIKKAMVAFAAVLAMSLMLLPSVKADAAVTVPWQHRKMQNRQFPQKQQ